MTLKDLPEKFYNDLVKADYIKELQEFVDDDNNNTLIAIDLVDIYNIAKNGSELVGTIAQVIDNADTDLDIKYIKDIEPTDCIFHIISDDDLTLATTNKLLAKLKEKHPNIQMIFGITNNKKDKNKIKIQAILTTHNE